MSLSNPDITDVLSVVRAYILSRLPGEVPEELVVKLASGRRFTSPVPAPGVELPQRRSELGSGREPAEPFIPTPYQQAILEALEGKALRTDGLANLVGDRSRLFRHPGGLKELQEQGLVAHHKRLGFYRPDVPPEELAGE